MEASKTLDQTIFVSNRFANEEVASSYGYLSGYCRPISDQIDVLRGHWPMLNPDFTVRYARDILPTLQLPGWVEGSFIVVRPGFFSNVYGEELEEVMLTLSRVRGGGKFHNYREGQLGGRFLRQHERSVAMWRKLGEMQKGDILLVPAQLGLRHRGRSVRRGQEVYVASEFGLGAFASGVALLTHPNRLQHYEDLLIDCAGDEYAPEADDVFSCAPCWYFSDGGLKFDAHKVNDAYPRCGSASAFLPE